VNDHNFNFRTGNTGGGFDLQTVVLHEMGHYLGLPHKSGNTVMVPYIDSTDNHRAPTSIDITDIATKYGINLSSGSSSAISTNQPQYVPNAGDTGKQIKILLELHESGECVHKENGAVIQRHFINHKS
jgi:hypothetical protein